MGLFKKKSVRPLLLIAVRKAEVLEIVPADTFQVREAFSTRGVLTTLQASPRLMIVDLDDLVEVSDLPRAALQSALNAAVEDGIPLFTSEQFLSEGQQILGQSLSEDGARTAIRFMTSRVVLIANYCGGVGKTTLALATTRRFRQAAGLGAALVEAGMGGSSINARLGNAERPSLYGVVTQAVKPGQWDGVDVYPMDNREASALASDIERTTAAVDQIIQDHTLTIFDAFPGNPLWPTLLTRATDILVVTAPRSDSIAQTDVMFQELHDSLAAIETKPRLHLALNMVRTWGEKLPLKGQTDIILPYNEKLAQGLSASLADPVLNLLYPGWNKREKRNTRKGTRKSA